MVCSRRNFLRESSASSLMKPLWDCISGLHKLCSPLCSFRLVLVHLCETT
ncbi:hypothetical protein P3X46_000858 [Hevea brasiliensis]|uniref:Uncharacterized protein n=1 Tax=Hevea brasiliensis TaxID=3981 RepID=A0ABQ9NBG9_HEVBR|nr:hypothetical protein P3X46_000858 [Hevea brasiliensis]